MEVLKEVQNLGYSDEDVSLTIKTSLNQETFVF